MAVHKPQLAHADGQVSVGVRLGFVNEQPARAVHRLNGKIRIVNDGGIHVFLVMIPVPGGLPKLAVEHQRGRDLHIPLARVDLPPIVDQCVFEDHAVRQEEREAGTLVHHGKELELAPELSVIALFCFLNAREILVERRLLRERRRVNALEHFVVLVAAPVRACAGGQLERLYRACGHQVRPRAKLVEFTLPVKRDRLVLLGVLFDELDFIGLALFTHGSERLVGGERVPLKRQILLNDLFHFRLDLC